MQKINTFSIADGVTLLNANHSKPQLHKSIPICVKLRYPVMNLKYQLKIPLLFAKENLDPIQWLDACGEDYGFYCNY